MKAEAFQASQLAALLGLLWSKHTEHELTEKGIAHEPIRTDEYTHKRFVFFSDPDDLPIELYER